MSRDVPGVDVLLMPAALCTGGLAHIVREQLMATDAKSKVAANFLRFRFIDVFHLVPGFPFRGSVCLRYPVPEIGDEVPENFRND